jgi:ATP-dependent helicase/nuclease subunit B
MYNGLDAISINGKRLTALLRGFVDRVDTWEVNGQVYYRVVDYKTGKKDFDYCDIYNGFGLQMLLYMFALEQGGDTVLPVGAKPVGVQYFPARVPVISADNILSETEANELRLKEWKRKGLLLSDPSVLQALDATAKKTRLCCSINKDGDLIGDVATAKQFAQLKEYIFFLLKNMVDNIASGDVTPNPYTRGSRHNACSYCPYGEICHKSNVDGRRDYAAISRQEFWDEIRKEVCGHG